MCCSDRECIVGHPSINIANRRAVRNLWRADILEIAPVCDNARNRRFQQVAAALVTLAP
jgi:hypothetical protein